MFDGTLEIRTDRGSYRQPRNFNATPQLLDRMSVDVGERTGVACVIIEINPSFSEGAEIPTLHVVCEELSLHKANKR